MAIQLEQFVDRFGNQICSYAFARSISHKLGVALETPYWIGQEVFEIYEPPLSMPLHPSIGFNVIPDTDNVSFHGHYQYQRAYDVMKRSNLRKWLRIKPELLKLCPKPRPFYIACHIRRGDYVRLQSHNFAVIDKICYQRAISKYNYDERDVIWFAEEIEQPGSRMLPGHLKYLYDFIVMIQADVIFRANSTYSYWPSVLGTGDTYSPVVDEKTGFRNDIEFVQGFYPALRSAKNKPWIKESDTTAYIQE